MTISDAMNAQSEQNKTTTPPSKATNSSPFTQQRHKPSASRHRRKSAKHLFQRRILHVPAEHELVRHQLHQASINQNTSRDGIENTINDQRRLRTRRKRLPHAESDGDGDWRGNRISGAEVVGRVSFAFRPFDRGEAGAQGQAFEGLVEDEHDVEGGELGACYGEGEADEDGVEDYAEFEDGDAG
jgi:hypothetical protein